MHARAVAKELGCSVQPIFMNFKTMESLREAVGKRAEQHFNAALEEGLNSHAIPFLGMGLAYCRFAREEKQLFKLLFMSEQFSGTNVLDLVDAAENQPNICMVAQMAEIPFEQARSVFISIWLMVHGMASMLATNECTLSETTIEQLLKHTFTALAFKKKESV